MWRRILIVILILQLTHGTIFAGSPPASNKAVFEAVRRGLTNPKVASAARAEILRQLKGARPIAVVHGRWAVPVNLRPMFSNPEIRDAILGGSPGLSARDLLNPAITRGVAFIPPQVAGRIGVDVRGLLDTAAAGALASKRTDITLPTLLVIYAGLFTAGLLVGTVIWDDDDSGAGATPTITPYPHATPTGTGGNEKDSDGDGVNDDKDQYPDDPSKSIVGGGCEGCDINGVVFVRRQGDQVLSILSKAARTTSRLQSSGVTLGSDVRFVMGVN